MVKGKRWKKGQSSSSNPQSKKYREAAKNTFFNFSNPNAKSDLTIEALSKLDSSSLLNKKIDVDDDDNQTTLTHETFESWASNWSDCTNATFNRVHKYWKSNSALHKEILAVLAAVTEVIKDNNGKENEIEYFAALMTGLESVVDNENSTAAFLYLIALAIRKVPPGVLKVKFHDLLKSFTKLLEKYSEASNTTLMKSCLMCLCWLLKEQDKQTWQEELTQRSYFMILSFINHEKPKVRKCGQEAVKLILKTCSVSIIQSNTLEYCLKIIENSGNLQNNTQILYTLNLIKQIIHEFSSSSLKSICECLFRLLALNNIMITSACFQIFYQLFLCETTHLTANLNAQLINAFYDYQPSENDPQQLIAWLAVMEAAFKNLNRLNNEICSVHLPHMFNICMCIMSSYHKNVLVMSTNVIKTLLEQCIKPNISLYITEMKQNNELEKCLLNRIFNTIQNGLNYQYHSGWLYVMQILASAFSSFEDVNSFVIVKECLTSLANLRQSEQFSFKNEADYALSKAIKTYGPKLILEAINLNITGDEITYDYPRSWMLSLLRDNIEKTELMYFIKYFMPLAFKLREKSIAFNKEGKQFEFKIFDTLQNQIWALFPGFCNKPTDLSVSFKLIAKTLGDLLDQSPDLRVHIFNGLKNLINKNQDENKIIMSKFAKNYLPILFNIYMMDKCLDKDPLRQLVLETIRSYLKIADNTLINEFLQRAYNKYVEITVNIKSTTAAAVDDGTDKLDNNLFTKYSLLDLLSVMVGHSNEKQIKSVYDVAIVGINDNLDKTVQKKSYKILNTILDSGKPTASNTDNIINSFIKKNLNEITNTFVSTLANCNSAAKPPRLKCILDLLDYVNEKEFIRKILPEIIICIKEVNHKSRDAAYSLINSMAKLWQKLSAIDSQKSEPEALYEYVHLLMTGLAGSKTMVSCSCLALSALSSEFKEHITGNLIRELIDASCLLLTKSNEKEIVLSSLNLIKTLCIIFNDTVLAQYLDDIFNAFISLQDSINKKLKSQRIRLQMKVIIKKLIKKFSYQLIYEKLTGLIDPSRVLLKQDFHKQLVHLRKLIEREKKIKESKMEREKENNSSKDVDLVSIYTKATANVDHKSNINEVEYLLEDSSDEEDAKNDDKMSKKSRAFSEKTNRTTVGKKLEGVEGRMVSGKANAWLKEGSTGDDPLNLLDPMAMRNVLATKPLTQEEIRVKKEKELYNKTKNRGFKVNKEGKLIIDDDEDDEKAGDDDEDENVHDNKSMKLKKKQIKKSGSNLDELMDTLSLSKKSTKSAKSKKEKDNETENDGDNGREDDAFSYKTGGTGIHRSLDQDQTKIKRTKSFGEQYRAKKARGDIKLPGKPDPFAYVPLNFNKLNKRKTAKLQGEFKGLVKAAKKGAKKGYQARKQKK